MQHLIKFVISRFSAKIETIDYDLFFKVFTRALVIYFVVFFSTLDWSIYILAADELFAPIQGLGSLLPKLPSLPLVMGMLVIYVFVGLKILFKPKNTILLTLFLCITILLDLFHNSLGFMNVQTHAILFFVVVTVLSTSKNNLRDNQFWALRSIELIFVMVYFQSAVSKIVKSGLAWGFDGTTFQIAMFRQMQPLGVSFSQFAMLCIVLSLITLFIEFMFPFFYFFSLKKQYLLFLSICFHLGTLLLMGIHFFHLWVFPLCYLFVHFTSVYKFRPKLVELT